MTRKTSMDHAYEALANLLMQVTTELHPSGIPSAIVDDHLEILVHASHSVVEVYHPAVNVNGSDAGWVFSYGDRDDDTCRMPLMACAGASFAEIREITVTAVRLAEIGAYPLPRR